MTTCSAITRSGSRCQARPINGGSFCFFHDPERQQERRAASARGGKAETSGSEAVREIRGSLAELYRDVLAGVLDRQRAAVLCQIGGQQLRALQVEADLAENGELLARLAALEAALQDGEAS